MTTLIEYFDQKVRRAFSNASVQYDVLSSMQKEIGRDLIKKIIELEDNKTILDVGMGTGNLTKRMSFYFPESTVIGIDFAKGMLKKAKEKESSLKVLEANASMLPFKDDSFDIIASNLAYHWAEDLSKAFNEAYRCLKPNGKFAVTIFGFKTLEELFQSLDYSAAAGGKAERPNIRRLPSIDNVNEALKLNCFQDINVKDEIIKVHFPTMMDLLRWVKDIGANSLSQGVFLGKDLLVRANEYYKTEYADRFGVTATFQVIWIEARK